MEDKLKETDSKAIIHEIYSPVRVNGMASKLGLMPGMSLDLTVEDEEGNAWDFDKAAMREKAEKLIRHDKPLLLIGSP